MELKVLFATALVLASAVHGCVVFEASWGCVCDNGHELFSVLIDNGIQMCTMKGPPSSGETYHFTCAKANYTASFDAYSGILSYYTDHGSWAIPTSSVAEGYWTTCQFGCSDQQCWVKPPGSDGRCSSPSPSPHNW